MSTAFGILLLCQQETLYSCCLSCREGEGLGEHIYIHMQYAELYRKNIQFVLLYTCSYNALKVKLILLLLLLLDLFC